MGLINILNILWGCNLRGRGGGWVCQRASRSAMAVVSPTATFPSGRKASSCSLTPPWAYPATGLPRASASRVDLPKASGLLVRERVTEHVERISLRSWRWPVQVKDCETPERSIARRTSFLYSSFPFFASPTMTAWAGIPCSRSCLTTGIRSRCPFRRVMRPGRHRVNFPFSSG